MVVEGCNRVYLLDHKVASESLWYSVIIRKGDPMYPCSRKTYVVNFFKYKVI